MITGFNTDIEYDGVVYHVQTEDKGLDTPLILSLVYTGGEILASKRAPYEDLIAAGFDEDLLAQRVKRQHRLICAAINAGRIEDLKRMSSGRAEGRSRTPPPPPRSVARPEPVVGDQTLEEPRPTPVSEAADIRSLLVSNSEDQPPPVSEPVLESVPKVPEEALPEVEPPPVPSGPSAPKSAYTVHDSRRQSPLGEKKNVDQGVVVTILDEVDYRAGQSFNIRVMVEKRTGTNGKPMSGVPLSVKILGTTFRPQLYSVKTGKDGVAVICAQIPRFSSGRAAILIRANVEGKPIETRRVIHAAL